MAVTTQWAPNQALVSQVETYQFSAPSGVGNWYQAAINGKVVRYVSIAGDTAALAATGLYTLLNVSTGVAPELTEITFANPSDGVMTATAKVPGTPFANVPGTTAGLVLSTGNGLANGIVTTHTTANASPSDVIDAQNWLRCDLSTTPPNKTRAVPQGTDDVVVANSTVPLLWNLDQLAATTFNTYTRWQSFEAQIGLPDVNPNGYTEWRATYFKFSGPAGSAPAGGLQVVLGFGSGSGAGPTRERYDFGSSKYTLTALAAGSSDDDYGIKVLGMHTDSVMTLMGGVSVAVAMRPGEVSKLNTVTLDGGATLAVGSGVTWSTSVAGAVSTLTTFGGSALLNAAPATVVGNSGTAFTVTTDGLPWATMTLTGGCTVDFRAGGTITTLTLSNGCSLDKANDARPLAITNHTLDGDSCFINDPLNAVTYTNAGTVKQRVEQGPYRFTGSRTVKVT